MLKYNIYPLVYSGEIEGEDYRTIKSETGERIADIEAKLKTSVSLSDNKEPLWELPISKMAHLDVLFQNGTVIQKRKIVSALFPDNLTFDGVKFHRTRVSAAISLLMENKKSKQAKAVKGNEITMLKVFI